MCTKNCECYFTDFPCKEVPCACYKAIGKNVYDWYKENVDSTGTCNSGSLTSTPKVININAQTLDFLQEFVETLQVDPSQAEHGTCDPKECNYVKYYLWVKKLTVLYKESL